jgi:hypothetical protein
MGRYKWKTYTSKKLNARYKNWEEPHKLNDHACDSLRYFMMSRPNLDMMFSDENRRPKMDEIWDDSVRVHVGDWTVKQIRAEEWDYLQAQNTEYANSSGYDELGGLW